MATKPSEARRSHTIPPSTPNSAMTSSYFARWALDRRDLSVSDQLVGAVSRFPKTFCTRLARWQSCATFKSRSRASLRFLNSTVTTIRGFPRPGSVIRGSGTTSLQHPRTEIREADTTSNVCVGRQDRCALIRRRPLSGGNHHEPGDPTTQCPTALGPLEARTRLTHLCLPIHKTLQNCRFAYAPIHAGTYHRRLSFSRFETWAAHRSPRLSSTLSLETFTPRSNAQSA